MVDEQVHLPQFEVFFLHGKDEENRIYANPKSLERGLSLKVETLGQTIEISSADQDFRNVKVAKVQELFSAGCGMSEKMVELEFGKIP